MNLPNAFPALGLQVTTKVQTTVTKTPKYKFKKAGTAGTLIAVVLDESGSMASCLDATIAGFNEYVAGQRAATDAGAGYLTLNKFEGGHIRTVFADRPLSEVPPLDRRNYTPNGGTNLLDAIGHTIEQVNATLDGKKKKDRPGVIIVITTDGEENSSRNYNNDQIKAMVAAAEKSDWSFVFMGANIDSFSVGSAFGMNAMNTVNYSTANMSGTMAALSATTTRMRSAKMAGADTQTVYASAMFTSEEKKNMGGK
jgi:uncharacterized protein YegL